MSRHIGLRHRIKRTAEGEAHPTEVHICLPAESPQGSSLTFKDETEELDFVLSRGKFEDSGLQAGDIVSMVLGGSGDNLAYAMSRQAEEVGAQVWRLPAFVLKRLRQEMGLEKTDDSVLLSMLIKSHPDEFYVTRPHDRDLIWVRECYRRRQEAMRARIACTLRLYSSLVGRIFCSPEGKYPEGKIEQAFDEAKANDAILAALVKEEGRANYDLGKSLKNVEVWTKILEEVEGVGPAIAAGIISAIMDIRRFPTAPALKKFCGVAPMADGRFPRKRRGEICNHHPAIRQALFQLGDQFNRRPESYWGQRLKDKKAQLRAKHPEVELNERGKKMYTDAHIHRMATWATLAKFVEWLWREWWRLEQAERSEASAA